MLSGIASYLFGGASEEEHPAAATPSAEDLARSMQGLAPGEDPSFDTNAIRLKERLAEDDDWTIVDRASSCSSSRHVSPCGRLTPSTTPPESLPRSGSSSNSSSQYRVLVSDSDDRDSSIGADDTSDLSLPERVVNPSMAESWLVTPPPCFTALGSSSPASSPLENLLIEHPSMSVYNTRGRPSSRGVDSEDSSESSMDCTPVATSSRGTRTSRVTPRQAPSHRPVTQAAAASRALVKSTRSMQAATRAHEARKHTRAQMMRSNQTRIQHSTGKQRRKHLLASKPSRACNDRKSQ